MDYELTSEETYIDLYLDSGYDDSVPEEYSDFDILSSEESSSEGDFQDSEIVYQAPENNETVYFESDLNQEEFPSLSSEPVYLTSSDAEVVDYPVLTEGEEKDNQTIIISNDPESKEHLQEIKDLLKTNLSLTKVPESSDYDIDDIYLSMEDLKEIQEELKIDIVILGKNQELYNEMQLGFLIAFFSAFIVYLFIGRFR